MHTYHLKKYQGVTYDRQQTKWLGRAFFSQNYCNIRHPMQFHLETALSMRRFLYSTYNIQYNFDRTGTMITMTCLSGNNNNGHITYICLCIIMCTGICTCIYYHHRSLWPRNHWWPLWYWQCLVAWSEWWGNGRQFRVDTIWEPGRFYWLGFCRTKRYIGRWKLCRIRSYHEELAWYPVQYTM